MNTIVNTIALRTGLGALLLLVMTSPAMATIDAILQTNIVTAFPQDDGVYCYTKVPLSTELGIPAAVMAEGSLSPAYARRLSTASNDPEAITIEGLMYKNINVLARGAPITHTYLKDSFTESGTMEYRAELDISALAAQNGDSAEGRQRTIDVAKLALLALAKNLKDAHGMYRMWITFNGLPSQEGLFGARVYQTSNYPYSGGSPLLNSYEQELINKQICGQDTALYGKFDQLGQGLPGQAGAIEQSAGCAATGETAPGSAGLLALVIAGLGLWVVGRRRS